MRTGFPEVTRFAADQIVVSVGPYMLLVEHVRANRDDDLVGGEPGHLRESGPHRGPDRQHPVLHCGRLTPAGSDWDTRRTVHRRRGRCPQLLEATGTDG